MGDGDDQPGEQGDEGGEQRLQQRERAFLHRLGDLGCGVGDGGGAQPGLVGEQRALEGHREHAADEAALDARPGERPGEDEPERLRQVRNIRRDDDQRAGEVDQSLRRRDRLGDFGDALDRAEQHQPDEHGERGGDHPRMRRQ